MIRREPHGLAVDVWSFGICTLELANSCIPNRFVFSARKKERGERLLFLISFAFDRHNSIFAMFTNAVKGFPKPFAQPNNYSALFHEFMQGALHLDPKQRLSSKELRDHEWIRTTAASAKSMQKVISKIFTQSALDDLF